MSQAVEAARRRYRQACEGDLSLDLTRGKPSPEQLALSQPVLEVLQRVQTSPSGVDCRNYGGLHGLREVRELYADYLDVEFDEIIVQDNASLRLMFDLTSWCQFLGTSSGPAWSQQGQTKFLCPTPGYDRHFHLLEHLGIETLAVPMDENGPDLDTVQRLVADDDSVKGMYCVPRFSNPTGVVYSEQVVETLAGMPTAADDFRIFWDNAYAHHLLSPTAPELAPILEACKRAGAADRAIVFGSTSKVTLAGSGISMVAVAGQNREWLESHLSKQTIGPNKLIQLAHLEFLHSLDAIKAHMARHAELLRPRFEIAAQTLEERLGGFDVATWSKPQGGYFISLDTPPGCAARTVELASAAGVKLTPAGATSPYGRDPEDRNLRLAPSFPSVDQVRLSAEVLADSVLIAAAESNRA